MVQVRYMPDRKVYVVCAPNEQEWFNFQYRANVFMSDLILMLDEVGIHHKPRTGPPPPPGIDD